ncbi:hypothetical protein VT84_09410 [Gemmata sp. SH-PL17]|uniref:hypothetical protein n=1 Tax=Gemmata sp. SH-PL17 TaxID=1630693 RepID=UPI00078C29F4|nr:hypothetical protein [Gemmata sp. SH-PL17]AMV24601.1 hypothetical protein VT84_09410 [Gemmata sp. SH-PL17]
MPAPDPLAAGPEAFDASHWKEAVRNFRPSGANSFSSTGAEAVLEGIISGDRVRGALRFFLGYNAVQYLAGTYLIQRTNPAYHPRYTRLICTSVAEEEFKPGTKTLSSQTRLKVPANGFALAATNVGNRAAYQYAKITARFTPLVHNLFQDDQIDRLAQEWKRNVWVDVEPRIEFLSLDGFTLKFAEGESNAPPVSNPKGTDYPAPFGQILVKPDIVLHWGAVPSDFVLKTDTDLPKNILDGMGKVNRDEFRGYPAGTLLLLGAKLNRVPWALAMGTESAYVYNIELLMNYFNPTKGKASGFNITTNLGHNNMPWRGPSPVVAGDTNSGKWFLATRTGGSGAASVDPRLVEDYDYIKLFQSPNNS